MVIRDAVYRPAQRWPDDLPLSQLFGQQASLTISRQATATEPCNIQRQKCRNTATVHRQFASSPLSVPGTFVLIGLIFLSTSDLKLSKRRLCKIHSVCISHLIKFDSWQSSKSHRKFELKMIQSSRLFLILTLLASHLLLGCDETEHASTGEAKPTAGPSTANPTSERSPNHRLAAKYKLPKFKTESPKFCIWNFPGDNGTHEVPVAWDDNVLYCDRNGNRDLTEPDERIERTLTKLLPAGYRQFEVDEIVVGNKSHLSTILSILTSYQRFRIQVPSISLWQVFPASVRD